MYFPKSFKSNSQDLGMRTIRNADESHSQCNCDSFAGPVPGTFTMSTIETDNHSQLELLQCPRLKLLQCPRYNFYNVHEIYIKSP